MKGNKPLVIVLSRNYSTGLSVIRSLGAAGYTVDLVASAYKAGTSRIASSSKYVRKSVEVVSQKVKEGDGDNGLLTELLKYAGQYEQKPVIFPTDDYTTSVMDQNREVLEEHFIMPTIVGGGNGCLTDHMDKTLQAKLAQEAGLLTPREWIISLADAEIDIPAEMVYPCFCKPIESVTGYKREMARCNDEKALRDHLTKLQKNFSNRSILVQEFLEIDNEIDLSGVCLDEEIIIPAIIRKWNVAKYERGVTLAGKIVPFEELGDLQQKIVAMLKKFHYVGMFDMELNIVGDKIYFNEVNLRSGGPNFSYFMSGVNLPALFVKEALGTRHTPEEEWVSAYGKSFIYEKVAWEDYMHGYMSKRELDDRMAAADITLLNNSDDPEPCRLFMRQMKLSLCKARLVRAKRNFVKWAKKTARSILRPFVKPLRFVKYTALGYPQMKKANRYNPFAEKPRVVIAGRNYCSNLCMARSIGKAGYEVEVLRIFQTRPKWFNLMSYMRPDAYSQYIKGYHVLVTRRKAKAIVRKLVQIADPYRKMLLIPADDLVANVADEYMEKLSKYYVLPNINNTPGEIARMMGKDTQKQLAAEFGLPVINSCSIQAYKGNFEIPASVNYPCFIKPNISKDSSKSKMRRIDSEEELRATLTEYSKSKAVDMLVEDFIDIGREYSILGLSTRDGVVSPGFFGVLEGGHGPHRGVAMTGELIPTQVEQELIDQISAFIGTLGYNGLFDVDLIQDKNGKMYFVELNLRYGASGYAVTESGANLPGMFADYMLMGKPIDMDVAVQEFGRPFISEKIMVEEYVNGYLSKEERKRQFKNVDIHFVYNEEDPAAYRHFKKFYPAAALMRTAFALKNGKVE